MPGQNRGSKEPASSPAQRNKTERGSREQTTERILDAAEELFAERNPTSVTVREVAEQAGVTHALVHQYVGTKQDLLNAVFQRVARSRTGIIEESDALQDIARALVEQVVTNRVHSMAVMRSAMDGVEYVSLEDRIRTGRALVKLAEATAASEAAPSAPPRGIDVRVIVGAISSMAFGWSAFEDWAWQTFGLDPADKEDVCRQLGDIAAHLADLVWLPLEEETGT